MILSKEQILSKRLGVEDVPIPWEQEQSIRVRALPNHVIEHGEKLQDGTHGQFVFVNAVVDEGGDRMFSDDDANMVGETVDRALIELVVAAAYRLSSIPKDRQEAIKKNWITLAGESSGE